MANGFKTGGRQKGTQNKVSGTIKEMISLSIRSELESLPTLLKNLEPKERIDAILKLMAYLVPKANSENDDPIHAKQNRTNSLQKLHKMMFSINSETLQD